MSNNNELMSYTSMTGDKLELSPQTVKQYLVSGDASKVSDQEVMMFMQLCKFQKLNPFLREAYLIKYGNAPATIVTGKETFLKRAANNPKYQGHEVGIEEDGSMAWAEVYVEGYVKPVRCEVEFDEYVGKKASGETNAQWKTKPKTMLKKVALVQALREAFPADFGGMYSPEEIREEFTDEPKDITPKTSTVKPAKKEPAKSKQAAKASTSPEDEGDVRKSLKDLLNKVCAGDEEKILEVLKTISVFEGKDGDVWMKNMGIIDTTKIGWVGKAYSALKEMIVKDGLVPKECTHDPNTCSSSSFEGGLAYCGEKDCPMQANKEF